MKKLQLPALSNAKKLKRSELKSVFGGEMNSENETGSGVPSEGYACYCGGNFRGYVYTVQACQYICEYRP